MFGPSYIICKNCIDVNDNKDLRQEQQKNDQTVWNEPKKIVQEEKPQQEYDHPQHSRCGL